MEHYAGLDVSVKETSVCVVDGAGQVVREVKVASEPGAILGFWQMRPSPSSVSASRRGRCRSGSTGRLPKRTCR